MFMNLSKYNTYMACSIGITKPHLFVCLILQSVPLATLFCPASLQIYIS